MRLRWVLNANLEIYRSIVRLGRQPGVGEAEAAFAGTVTNGYRDLVLNKADYCVFDGKEYLAQMPFAK